MKLNFGIYAGIFGLGLVAYTMWYSVQPDVVAANLKKAHDVGIAYMIKRNQELKNTPGMEDCNFYLVDGYASVIRCPNSTVTTETGGKFHQRTVTNSN